MTSIPQVTVVARAISLVVAMLVISGCNAVYVSRPVGDRPHVLQPEKWNGVWLSDDNSPVTVLVTDAENGQLQVGSIEPAKGTLTLNSQTILIRESGEWLYLNVRDSNEGKELYSWAPAKQKDDLVVFWNLNIDKFRNLVRSGKLKGETTDKGNVYLESLSADMLAAITAGELGALLEWQEPITLRRVKR